MKITEINLVQLKDVTVYFSLTKRILAEFLELPEMYEEIAIFVGNKRNYQNGSANVAISKFLGLSEGDRIHTEGIHLPAHCLSKGKKGCVQIVMDVFETLPLWKQAFAVRHEFCHLLHPLSHSPTLDLLSKKYSREWLANLGGYRWEYQVHLCVIKRYLDDWLREPLGISKDIMSPRSLYRRERKMKGAEHAISIAIANSVNILRIIYLNEYLLTITQVSNQLKEQFKQNLKRYEGYLDSWWRCLQKDVKSKLPMPRELLSPNHFEDEEAFFRQISHLLAIAGI